MPRFNWRPPSGLPEPPPPVAVEDDQGDDEDDQQLPEAQPDDSLPTVERVIFLPQGTVIHLKWPDDESMFCGRFPMNGAFRVNSQWPGTPVCKRCQRYPVVMPAPDDPASYEAHGEYVRVRFVGHGGDLAKVVHLRRIGQEDSPFVFCGLRGQSPASPTSVVDGPLCQHCVWDMNAIKERERYWASVRQASLGSGRR